MIVKSCTFQAKREGKKFLLKHSLAYTRSAVWKKRKDINFTIATGANGIENNCRVNKKAQW